MLLIEIPANFQIADPQISYTHSSHKHNQTAQVKNKHKNDLNSMIIQMRFLPVVALSNASP